MELRFPSPRGVGIVATDDATSAIFSAFYSGFDEAFTLPNEKEEREGFVEAMALNRGPDFDRIGRALGPFRELVLVMELDGQAVGGASVIITPLAEHGVVSINLNYAYVLPSARGRGLLRSLVGACQDLASWLFPTAGPVITFLELNDPLLLTAEQYAQDSEASGVDQFDRVAVWARLGVLIVDFPYVQPPLSDEQAEDHTLMLGVLAPPGFTLSGAVLSAHLERFFAISVLKTGDVGVNASAARQVADCRIPTTIRLLDPAPVLDRLRAAIGTPGAGLRERLSNITSQSA